VPNAVALLLEIVAFDDPEMSATIRQLDKQIFPAKKNLMSEV